MSKVVVTGGAGFIGSHLVDSLVTCEVPHDVVVIDDLSGGKKENVRRGVKFYNADCRDAQSMDTIFSEERPDVVYHLACNAAENKSLFSPIDITSRNYDAFIKGLTPFIRYRGRRFIFTSSIAVYGSLQTPFYEVDTPLPEDVYGITKLAAEQTLRVMSLVHGFEYVIARPHNVYGPRQNMSDPYRNVLTIFMNTLLQGKSPVIYGDGNQRRCFSYVSDVVAALFSCLSADVSGGTYNIGSDTHYSINEVYEEICRVSGIRKSATYLPDRPQEVREAIADHALAKVHLRYGDTVSLREGIRETWKWVRSVGKVDPSYTPFEIDSPRIPENWRRP
jgi:UDP-glucose 4-epimerase